jgi:hypothetical protein
VEQFIKVLPDKRIKDHVSPNGDASLERQGWSIIIEDVVSVAGRWMSHPAIKAD